MQVVFVVVSIVVVASVVYDWWLRRRDKRQGKMRLTRLTIKAGDVLLVEGCSFEDAKNLYEHVGLRAKHVTLIWLQEGQTLKQLGDEAMGRNGWVRAKAVERVGA